MAARMTELEPRTLERLRADLAELIAATVAYPPYFDFRANRLVTRPIDRTRMDEIQRYLSSANFGPLERADVSSAETRRFIERLVTRYLEVNDGIHGRYAARYLPRLRAMAPRVAAEAQRRALGYLSGSVPDFGARRQTISWTSQSRLAPTRSDEDRERAAHMLETALLQRVSASQALPAVKQDNTGAHSSRGGSPRCARQPRPIPGAACPMMSRFRCLPPTSHRRRAAAHLLPRSGPALPRRQHLRLLHNRASPSSPPARSPPSRSHHPAQPARPTPRRCASYRPISCSSMATI